MASFDTILINFTPSSDDGGDPITDYKYSIDGGNTFVSAGQITSPITVSGLSAKTTYNIQIRAVNSIGDGLLSNLVTFTTPEDPSATPHPLPDTNQISQNNNFPPPTPLPQSQPVDTSSNSEPVDTTPEPSADDKLQFLDILLLSFENFIRNPTPESGASSDDIDVDIVNDFINFWNLYKANIIKNYAVGYPGFNSKMFLKLTGQELYDTWFELNPSKRHIKSKAENILFDQLTPGFSYTEYKVDTSTLYK